MSGVFYGILLGNKWSEGVMDLLQCTIITGCFILPQVVMYLLLRNPNITRRLFALFWTVTMGGMFFILTIAGTSIAYAERMIVGTILFFLILVLGYPSTYFIIYPFTRKLAQKFSDGEGLRDI